MESYAVGIDDLHVADLLLEDPGALGAIEAELHVLGGEWIAVVELEALAQLELVDPLIGAERPRLGQARRHDVAGHGLHERVVERILDPERGDEPQHLSRIEPGRGDRHVERPAHLALGLRLGVGSPDEAAGEQKAQHYDREGPQEPAGEASWAVHALSFVRDLSHRSHD
jgi:hypothetical protein